MAYGQTDTIYTDFYQFEPPQLRYYYLGRKSFKYGETTRDSSLYYTVRYQNPGDSTAGIMRSYLTKTNVLIMERHYKGKGWIVWHGTTKAFDTAGTLVSEIEFADDRPSSPLKMFYGNGKLKRQETLDAKYEMKEGHCYDGAGAEEDFFPYFQMAETPYHLGQYISSYITYPKAARRREVHGKVYIKFFLDSTGKVHNPVVEQGIGYGCDEEAYHAVQAMPARLEGKPILIWIRMPVNFQLR